VKNGRSTFIRARSGSTCDTGVVEEAAWVGSSSIAEGVRS